MWKVDLFIILLTLLSFANCQESRGDDPSLKLTIGSIVIEKGKSAFIGCECVYADPSRECHLNDLNEGITWLDPNNHKVQEPLENHKHRYKVIRQKNLKVLLFEEALVEDSGDWTCQSGRLKKTLTVHVIDKVHFEDQELLSRQYTVERSDTLLRCKADGYPKPTIRWFRDNREITPNLNHLKYSISSEGALRINKVSRSDAGVYYCKAIQVTPYWSSHDTFEINLFVKHPPIIAHEEVNEIYGFIGETKEIKCIMEAYPPPRYSWIKRRRYITQQIPESSDSIVTAEDGSSSILSVPIRTTDDFVEYICKAVNEQGSNKFVFHLTPGNVPEPPTEINLAEANATSLVLEIPCENCTTVDDVEVQPDNLPITGYRIQITEDPTDPSKPWETSEMVDWDSAVVYDVDREFANTTLYVVGDLNASTTYKVRVASRNLAGYSNYSVELNFSTSLGIKLTYNFNILTFVFISLLYFSAYEHISNKLL